MSELLFGPYKDTGGLVIPDDRIIEMLDEARITEDEITIFLGRDRCEVDGFVLSFLQTFICQDQYYMKKPETSYE